MIPLASIEKPTLLLDKAKVMGNINKMAQKAQRSGVQFRPHFKTHQSAVIGEWFRQRGVRSITVSSVDMAVYFAAHGWDDITIAFPVNLRQINRINELAAKIKLHLLVTSADTAVSLHNALTHPVHVWLKIDAGHGRTGILWHDRESITAVARAVTQADRLQWAGLLTHAGHTYRGESRQHIITTYNESVSRMNESRAYLQAQGIETAVSVGDTPGCSLVDTFTGVDEVRPGNFVFYDLVQYQLGACTADEIAVGVACPVVARHEGENKLILYGGAVHLSTERMQGDGRPCFGRIARLAQDGWGPVLDNATLVSISQEHGVLKTDMETFITLQVGDVVVVLPVHSCLTVDLYPDYLSLDGTRLPKMRTN